MVIRSPFRAVTLVLMSLALAAWYDCLTTAQYDRVKHTPRRIVEPQGQAWPVILRPGRRVCVNDVVPVKTFCLDGFPPGREVCVSGTIYGQKGLILEVFHDGGATSLGVRLAGQDLYWLHGHHFFMPGPVPVTGSRLCLTNRDVYPITVTGLEVRNHSGYNSGFPRFYFVPRNLLPVRLNLERFSLSAAAGLVALALWWFLSFRLVVRLGLEDQVTAVFLISLAPLLYVIPTSLGAIFLSTDRILFLRTEVLLITAGLVVIPQAAAMLIFKLVALGRARRSA